MHLHCEALNPMSTKSANTEANSVGGFILCGHSLQSGLVESTNSQTHHCRNNCSILLMWAGPK